MKILSGSDLRRTLRVPLSKSVEQILVEKWARSFWEQSPKIKHDGKPFVMMLPPPNITGSLHLGHALTSALQDAIVRHKYMQGYNVRWIPGFDHAGLAVQSIVERLIWYDNKITREELGKDKFIMRVEQWKESKRETMRTQLIKLGLALDWSDEFFTMDDKSSSTVKAAFKKLFELGLIYRAEKPVYYSKQLRTTLSDIEVDSIEGVHRYVRTGEVVERVPIPQWFVNTQDLAKRAVEIVNVGSMDIIPNNYKRSWTSWLVENGTQDWCISRQSWWGHAIPAYKVSDSTDTQENWVVADNIAEASSKLKVPIDNVCQDKDVLDTWFSSSLLPLTISGWPNEEEFKKNQRDGFFPLHILETGFDILTYWVSKMAMMSLALENNVPFNLTLMHGMICDSNGKKMSKSKGNVIDPTDIIEGSTLSHLLLKTKESLETGLIDEESYSKACTNQKRLFPKGIPQCGADGLRAYLLSHDVQEEIIRISMVQIDKIRRLTNKIWNVTRFALILSEPIKAEIKLPNNPCELDLAKLDDADHKIIEELAKCVITANKSFENSFCLHNTVQDQELFWSTHLSSTYIPAVRSAHQSYTETGDLDMFLNKCSILLMCINTSLKLMHPFMPHLTEFLFQKSACELKGLEYSELKPLLVEPYPADEDWIHFISDK